MTAKISSWQGYGQWLLDQTSNFEELVEKVAAVTTPVHPSDDHEFTESQEFSGTCSACGWIDPATETDCSCPKTLREHVKALPVMIREHFEMEMVMQAVIANRRAIIIEIGAPRRSSRLFDD